MAKNERGNFISNQGFILACVGSAIGVGNLWMFPWRLGQFGGAAFLIPYLLFVYVLGTIGLMGEFGLGRYAQRGAIGAFDKVLRETGRQFGRILGSYPVLTAWSALVIYTIVSGWILHYLFASVSGTFFEADSAGAYFGAFAGKPVTVIWAGMGLAASAAILYAGVSKGIERASRIMMPLLLVLFAILVVRSLTLPGAGEGIRYLLLPDWSRLSEPLTWAMALGQAFFTVSLAGSGMVVYGSYMSREMDIPSSALQTVSLDTAAALMASLIIIPATFAYGLDPASGPPLLFITLPEIFRNMPAGQIFAILFFLCVFIAAVSSQISIMEVVIEAVIDQLGWSRQKSVAAIGSTTLLICLPFATNMMFFTIFVDIVTVYMVPLAALLAAIVFFWALGVSQARKEINNGARRPVGAWWEPLAKYLFVGVAGLIVILQILYRIG